MDFSLCPGAIFARAQGATITMMNWGLFSRVAVSLSVVFCLAVLALGYLFVNELSEETARLAQAANSPEAPLPQTGIVPRVALLLLGVWGVMLVAVFATLRATTHPLSELTRLITSTSLERPGRKIDERLRARHDEVGALACAFDAMIANLQKSYRELEQREAHYRQLVETAKVTPWELDLQHWRITYVGPQVADVLGYPQQDWYAPNFWREHVYAEDLREAENFYRSVAAGSDKPEIEYRMKHASGHLVWLRDWVSLSSPEQEPPVLQGFLVDITEQMNTREELSQHREHLEQLVNERTAELAAANQELQAFADSVSMDLRAPLRIINGFSQALLEDCYGALDDEGKRHLQRIINGSRHMAQLIDDMLVLSRVTRQELVRTNLNLSELAEQVVAHLRQRHSEHPIDCEIQKGMRASGDVDLLRIVLEKLLDNAWKYTAGVERPCVECYSVNDNGREIFSIRDNGVGFDMYYIDKLFAPFQRLHNAADFQGAGVGLATVQRIIARHGGDVRGESIVGRGATLSFSLG